MRALDIVSLERVVGLVRLRTIACRALVELGVGVTKLDGDVSEQLSEMTDGVLLRDCSDQCGLSVGDVTNGSDVDGRLSGDDFGVERGNLLEVKVFECLWRQVSLSVDCLLLLFDDVFS